MPTAPPAAAATTAPVAVAAAAVATAAAAEVVPAAVAGAAVAEMATCLPRPKESKAKPNQQVRSNSFDAQRLLPVLSPIAHLDDADVYSIDCSRFASNKRFNMLLMH
jgi:hypothetical protein